MLACRPGYEIMTLKWSTASFVETQNLGVVWSIALLRNSRQSPTISENGEATPARPLDPRDGQLHCAMDNRPALSPALPEQGSTRYTAPRREDATPPSHRTRSGLATDALSIPLESSRALCNGDELLPPPLSNRPSIPAPLPNVHGSA